MPTTADYLNDLIAQRDRLAEFLKSSGVEAEKSETINILIDKLETAFVKPKKGFVITERNEDGYPTMGEIINMTEIPDYYFSCVANASTNYMGAGLFSKLESVIIPDSVTSIGNSAFNACSELGNNSDVFEIPKNIKNIGGSAFSRCIRLKTVTFLGRPDSIGTSFGTCSSLKTINVPWSEGEVSGAPWGATNATINYNYTGEE